MQKRVLIVEDEIFVALEIEHIAESAGFEVCGIAADQADALEAASKCDIALVDLNLRDGPTGSDIARALATMHGVRVIYVTANPAQVGPAATVALGVVMKPFRDVTIRAALRLAAAQAPHEEEIDIAGFMPFFPRPGSSRGPEYAG